MIKRDYYEVLGLDRSSSTADIKKAYRRLALQYHPDRNPDDPKAEEKFKEASEAYEVLSDPQRRQLFDAYGHAGLEGAGFHGFTNVSDIFASMSDIFEEFFGDMGGFGPARRARRRARVGADLRHDLVISFMDAAKGIDKEITVTRQVRCDTCEGTGQAPGTGRITCPACGGAGVGTQRQGFFVIQTTCSQCHGEGSRIEKVCEECRGHGRVRKSKKITVKIPAGVEDGMRLVLRGEGQLSEQGGPPGDLYVFINVEPHDFFERIGDDLVCSVPISFPQAALGANMTIPSLDGDVKLEIPPGTETGDELRIKGEGLPSVHHKRQRGDLVARISVKTPKKLSKKQRQLLEEFIKGEG